MQADEPFDPQAIPEGVTTPDVCNIPDEIHYLFVIPQPPCSTYKEVKANVITFRECTQTFESLMDVYFQDLQSDTSKSKSYSFWLGNGFQLDASFTIRDLHRMLGRQRIDGVVLYLNLKKIVKKGTYYEECCLLDYFGDKNGTLLLRFNIFLDGSANSEIIYINYSLNDEQNEGAGDKILRQLAKIIQSQLGLANMSIERISEATIITPDNKSVKFERFKRLIQQKIYNGSAINIKVTNPNKEQMKRVRQHEYNSYLLVFKEESTEGIKFKFDDIANMTFQDFYTNSLVDKDSTKKKETKYYLKIMDMIIRPEEKVNKAEAYFKNAESNQPLTIVAKVINEKMIFFDVIPALTQDKRLQFKIAELIIPQNQRRIRQECIMKSRQISQRSEKEYFKVASNIEPIIIYTSQLKYRLPNTKIQSKIYQSLNKYLRDNPVLSTNEDYASKDWRFKYASTLLKHLNHAQKYKGKVWRGIDYNPKFTQQDKGCVFTFKPFTSTSIKMETAISFAQHFTAKQPFHMFQFLVKNGRNIHEYSLRKEGEVLLEPFSEFQLIEITNSQINGHEYIVYNMQERQTSRQMPSMRANFVVWIDDRSDEPEKIFKKIKTEASSSTIFQRLRSTIQLQAWLSKHKNLLQDQTANIIFITNMTRKQREKWNDIAGVEGAHMIRKYSHKVPIFFYVGSFETAKNKLADHKFSTANALLADRPEYLLAFLQGFL